MWTYNEWQEFLIRMKICDPESLESVVADIQGFRRDQKLSKDFRVMVESQYSNERKADD
jgi:hypothetical protein